MKSFVPALDHVVTNRAKRARHISNVKIIGATADFHPKHPGCQRKNRWSCHWNCRIDWPSDWKLLNGTGAVPFGLRTHDRTVAEGNCCLLLQRIQGNNSSQGIENRHSRAKSCRVLWGAEKRVVTCGRIVSIQTGAQALRPARRSYRNLLPIKAAEVRFCCHNYSNCHDEVRKFFGK